MLTMTIPDVEINLFYDEWLVCNLVLTYSPMASTPVAKRGGRRGAFEKIVSV